MIVIFVLCLITAYILDILIITGIGFKEFSIFGAKFIKEETQNTLAIQQNYIDLFLERVHAAQKIISKMPFYMVEKGFKDLIASNQFSALHEFSLLLEKYFEAQNNIISIDIRRICDKEASKISEVARQYQLNKLQEQLLKYSLKNDRAKFFNINGKQLLIFPTASRIYPNDTLLIILKSKNRILIEDQSLIISMFNAFEAEVFINYREIVKNIDRCIKEQAKA